MLSFAHIKNVAHRDINLSNIKFIDKDCVRLKVIDWGSSKEFSETKLMIRKVGTSGFTAPEVLRKTERYNEKCDVFSAGVILFRLVTGRYPFDAFDDQKINDKVLRNKIKWDPKEWPPDRGAYELCQKMLEKDPHKRISSTDALEKDTWMRWHSEK